MQQNSLKVKIYKRSLWRERGFCLIPPILVIITLFMVLGEVLMPKHRIYLCISYILLVAAIINTIVQNVRNNHLLKCGEVILAKITSHGHKLPYTEYIECSFMANDGKLYLFAAKYGEVKNFMQGKNHSFRYEHRQLDEVEYVPVVVDKNNFNKYVICIEDLIWSFRTGALKAIHMTSEVTSVDVPYK